MLSFQGCSHISHVGYQETQTTKWFDKKNVHDELAAADLWWWFMLYLRSASAGRMAVTILMISCDTYKDTMAMSCLRLLFQHSWRWVFRIFGSLQSWATPKTTIAGWDETHLKDVHPGGLRFPLPGVEGPFYLPCIHQGLWCLEWFWAQKVERFQVISFGETCLLQSMHGIFTYIYHKINHM